VGEGDLARALRELALFSSRGARESRDSRCRAGEWGQQLGRFQLPRQRTPDSLSPLRRL